MTSDYDFHNPDNLTPTQVGDGYRLLLKSEIKKRSFSREIQKWNRYRNKWWQTSFQGSNIDSTYRVPLATWPLPEADYACPPVKHPEAQELQDRLAEPEWIPWHGGECPLKDDEVEEWEWKLRNGFICGPTNQVVSSLKLDWSWGNNDGDIIAYRVLKWKRPPMQTNLPPESCPVCGASEVASNGPRITYACGSSDYDKKPDTFKQASSCVSPVKESAPTDNDAWASLLRTHSQLNTKVAELEEQLATVKRERDYATEHLVILAKTFKLDGMTWSYVVSEVCSRFERLTKDRDYWKEASKEQEKCLMEWPKRYHELEAKLTTAEARLKQLEWRPVSVKPTKEDADTWEEFQLPD